MRPLPFVWPYALLFWAFHTWAYWPEWKITSRAMKAAQRTESKDRGSIRFIMAAGSIGMLIGYPAAFVQAWRFPERLQVPLFFAGLGVSLLGALLRRYCFRTLGSSFTGDVRASADQTVITTGPYRYVRHPSYTAGILLFTGVGLSLGSWFSLGLMSIATIAGYVYRVAVEERALLETIGAPYGEFMKSRKRYIPYIV